MYWCHVFIWYFQTIHRKCWCMYCWCSFIRRSVLTQYFVQHGNDNGKTLVSLETQLTPEILGENCDYIDKKKTCYIDFALHTCVYTSLGHASVYRIYAVREFINTWVSIWNVNNAGLYLTIISEFIALNTRWSQNYETFDIFDIV